MSYVNVRQHMVQSWIELPMLVDQFVQRVATQIGCSREELRQLICRQLELNEYEAIGRICRAIAEAYDVLSRASDDVDVTKKQGDPYQTGVAAAVVRAWHDGGEEASAIQDLDREEVEAIKVLPWRIWSDWNAEAWQSGVKGRGQTEDDARQDAAYEVLRDFMESCAEWRDQILTAYTLVREGTPVGLNAIDEAADLVREISGEEGRAFEDHVKRVLSARGFYAGLLENVTQRIKRLTPTEELQLGGWRDKRYEAMLERQEAGEDVIQVRELRELCRWLPPELVDGMFERGPCMWQMLARMNDDAYVVISTNDEDETISPFNTVYVEREEDIAEALRCNGYGGEAVNVVSREEALRQRVPRIAGWWAVTWWE